MTPPALRVPEKNKRPGVHYALTDDGIELPVIDVTHPAFRLDPAPGQFEELHRQYVASYRRTARLPGWVRSILFAVLRRRCLFVDGLLKARGGHLDGTTTYLMKLGAENLGEGYTTAMDRSFAAGFPPFMARWRIQQMACFLSEALEETLLSRTSLPLLLVNIAGGTAVDSLNALIALRKRNPHVLEGRSVRVLVFDLDDKGPSFGKRALAALQEEDGPLRGLDVAYEHISYDWNDITPLAEALVRHGAHFSVTGVSTEGGLFEYGGDEAILRNLRTLHEATSEVTVVAGSVMLDEEDFRKNLRDMGLTTIPRSREDFRSLVQKAGWRVTRLEETPASFNVRLGKD